jgi:hypothetical protein
MAYLKNKQRDIPKAEQSERLVVTPRASNAEQAVTQTVEKEPEVVKTGYTPSHPLIGNLLDAFSQAEHRGTGTVDSIRTLQVKLGYSSFFFFFFFLIEKQKSRQ